MEKNKVIAFEIKDDKGNKSHFWIHYDEWVAMKRFRENPREAILEKQEEDSYYYVNLANSDDSIHATGMKSRKTGKIYLCKGYEVDITQPIENTDFHFVRNSTSFDL